MRHLRSLGTMLGLVLGVGLLFATTAKAQTEIIGPFDLIEDYDATHGMPAEFGPFDNVIPPNGVDKVFEYTGTGVFTANTRVTVTFMWGANGIIAGQFPVILNIAGPPMGQMDVVRQIATGKWILRGECPPQVWIRFAATNPVTNQQGLFDHHCVPPGMAEGTDITPAPTLSEWAMIAFAGLTVVGGGYLLRRQISGF